VSEILETRSRSRESEILECQSRIFYLGLRNPAGNALKDWQTGVIFPLCKKEARRVRTGWTVVKTSYSDNGYIHIFSGNVIRLNEHWKEEIRRN